MVAVGKQRRLGLGVYGEARSLSLTSCVYEDGVESVEEDEATEATEETGK